MNKEINLTEGNISRTIIKLSLPIIGTSFIQMAYNMIDMIWLGRVGSDAVAASGTAGFFLWFGMSFVLISKIGGEIGVAQSLGEKDFEATKKYISNAIILNVILGVIYAILLILFSKQLISFFNLGNADIENNARVVLIILAVAISFNFINPVFTGILNGAGDSSTPFYINACGLVFNIICDPLLIFGVGAIKPMGVIGAAIATSLAQLLVTLLFIIVLKKRKEEYFKINIFKYYDRNYIKKISKLGVPIAIQNGVFSFLSMTIARIIAVWGPVAVAVQKVGSQIESISWMTAEGFSSALGAFVGQNYGAEKTERIGKGYIISLILACSLGLMATVLFVGFGSHVFALFIPEKEAISLGVSYLGIVGLSQIFMCIEITTTGAFNGLGRTTMPSIISVVFTALRIPLALILSKTFLGLDGVWWSISISSILKGIILFIIFYIFYMRKNFSEIIIK